MQESEILRTSGIRDVAVCHWDAMPWNGNGIWSGIGMGYGVWTYHDAGRVVAANG